MRVLPFVACLGLLAGCQGHVDDARDGGAGASGGRDSAASSGDGRGGDGSSASPMAEDASSDAAPSSSSHAGQDAATPQTDAGEAVTYSTKRDEFFGAARCPKEALLCEDFEAASLDTSTWSVRASNNGTSLAIESTRAARGKQALHLHVTSGYSEAFITETKTFPAAAQGFWGRLFFYVESPIPSQFNHWTVAEAVGIENGNTNVLVRYGGIDNPGIAAHHWLFNYEKAPHPQGFNELGIDDQDVPGGRARQIASDTWHCLEWRYDVANSEAQLFWDGVERPTLHATGQVSGTPMQFPSFSSLNVGWTVYQSFSDPYDVWLDGVTVSLERIGCQR